MGRSKQPVATPFSRNVVPEILVPPRQGESMRGGWKERLSVEFLTERN
jgi:hypothetical protein